MFHKIIYFLFSYSVKYRLIDEVNSPLEWYTVVRRLLNIFEDSVELSIAIHFVKPSDKREFIRVLAQN